MYLVEKNLTRFNNLGYTFFLNPSETKQVCSKLKKNEYQIFRPFPDSEKNIIYHGSTPQILLYEIKCKVPIRHQDILGTMYSLDIAPDLFGDVVIVDGHYYVYILPIVENYFQTNLLMIRNSHVELKEIPVEVLEKYVRDYEEIELIVSSTRIDTVISHLIGESRESAKKKFQDNDIILNYEVLSKINYNLNTNDIFSIRK